MAELRTHPLGVGAEVQIETPTHNTPTKTSFFGPFEGFSFIEPLFRIHHRLEKTRNAQKETKYWVGGDFPLPTHFHVKTRQ